MLLDFNWIPLVKLVLTYVIHFSYAFHLLGTVAFKVPLKLHSQTAFTPPDIEIIGHKRDKSRGKTLSNRLEDKLF